MSEVRRPVGRLLSLNVGLPKDVPFRGATVHTGIWKQPVEGRRTVRRLDVDGDGQGDLAGHGGPYRAVLVYQSEAYAFWRQRLGRDDLQPGHFGENFTVDGLADDEICVGDRLAVGGALFEVTQPRVTCFRVGMRLAEPRMAALMVAEGRTGFYLRVIEEGDVGAGDDVQLVHRHPAGMTVAAVDALLYRPGHPRAAIERALSIDALSPGWRGSFEAMLAASGSAGNVGLTPAAAAPPPAWQGFRRLAVGTVVDEALGVRSFHLADPSADPLPPARGGQFVTLRLPAGPQGAPVSRPYSLSGPGRDGGYRISVKRENRGVMSDYLHDHVGRGAVIEVAAPRGTFLLPNDARPVVLATAGIGATPAVAMLHELAAAPPRPLLWLHVARNGRSHAFRDEADGLLRRLPSSVRFVAYTHPEPGDRRTADYDHAGRPDAGTVASLGVPAGAVAFVCGPGPFMAQMSSTLVAAGLAEADVHTEVFGAALTSGPVHQPAGPAGTGPEVTFLRSGLTTAWRDADGSLLELAEACGVPVRWSCRTGVCHTCETPLVSGTVVYDPDPVDLPATGNVLVCCSRPREPVVLDA